MVQLPLLACSALASVLVCIVCVLCAPVANAEFPIDAPQQRSFMGQNGDPAFTAASPAVGYDSTRGRYMMVWQGTDSAVDGPEIYGRIISGNQMTVPPAANKISHTPGALASDTPAITYDKQHDQYMVLWVAKRTQTGAREIFGQLLTHSGNQTGQPDIQVSSTGTGLMPFDASAPAVAYNPASGKYLVVWRSDQQANGEYEIYGHMLSSIGTPLGSDFRVSTMGPDNSTLFGADTPAVAADPVSNRFLVAWSGDNTVDGEREIWTRAYDGNGLPQAAGQQQISHMGPDGYKAFDAYDPALAFDPATSQYLLAWRGDTTGHDEEYEVYAQRLDAANNEVGATDFRVSDMGPDGNSAYAVAGRPAVVYNSFAHRYLVLWSGDDDTPPLVAGEMEVFGQSLDAGGQPLFANDFRVSTYGPQGDPSAAAEFPAAAYNPVLNQTFVVWQGRGALPLAPTETEIFSQRVGVDTDGDGKIDGLGDNCPTVPGGPFDANHDGCPDDTDHDGLIDAVDHCPSIARGAFDANRDGCPDDTDRDGVLDERDDCPTTPAGSFDPNHNGCRGPYGSLKGVRLNKSTTRYHPAIYVGVDFLHFVNLPRAKVTIVLRCTRGCRLKETLVNRAGHRTVKSRRFVGRLLRKRSIVTVSITSKNMIGAVHEYVVGTQDLNEIGRARCIPVGSHRAHKKCDPGS